MQIAYQGFDFSIAEQVTCFIAQVTLKDTGNELDGGLLDVQSRSISGVEELFEYILELIGNFLPAETPSGNRKFRSTQE
ncbi:MAG: hypothetical protein AAFV33_14525, partial [Chloroflexota bacterium]